MPQSPPPSSASPTASPTAPAPGGCTAAYQVVGEWPGSFQGAVTVTNAGPSPISEWTVELTFTGGQQVSQSWGGDLSQVGAQVTVQNAAWNGTLGPGASAEFGFIASWNGSNPVPGTVIACR